MKKSKIITTTLALGMVAIMGASAAQAFPHGQGMGPGPDGPRGGYGCPIYQALTPEQQSAAQALFAEHNKTVMPLRQALQAKQAELDVLYYSSNKDSAKVQAAYREMADLKAKLFSAEMSLRDKLAEKGIDDFGTGRHRGGGHHRGGGGRHGGHGWNR